MSPKKADKQAEGTPAAEGARAEISIAAHPRARAGIRRARTRAGLGAFALVLVLNLVGDQTLFDATWRALAAGIVVNVVAWRCAIVVWRHIILAELRAAEQRRADRKRAERERLEKLAAEKAEPRTRFQAG